MAWHWNKWNGFWYETKNEGEGRNWFFRILLSFQSSLLSNHHKWQCLSNNSTQSYRWKPHLKHFFIHPPQLVQKTHLRSSSAQFQLIQCNFDNLKPIAIKIFIVPWRCIFFVVMSSLLWFIKIQKGNQSFKFFSISLFQPRICGSDQETNISLSCARIQLQLLA